MVQTQDLGGWLAFLQQLHPANIALGLDRVRTVADRLAIDLSASRVVVVGGTNGKGSTVAALQAIALIHGLSVGTYTSPHLLRFNERIQLDGRPVDDDTLCYVFSEIERHRGDTALTFFEFTTLAALLCFQQYQPHICLLEVGLGGRLDAVNLVEPDISIVTNIQFDHREFLGDSREAIAFEKAGIFRSGVPAIVAELDPPARLLSLAEEKAARSLLAGRDFDLTQANDSWCWRGVDASGASVQCGGAEQFSLEPQAVAAALQAAYLLLPQPEPGLLGKAVGDARLRGRCQLVRSARVPLILDVAHNPAAAVRLAGFLAAGRDSGRTHLVIAGLGDKELEQIVAILAPEISGRCLLPELQAERARSARSLAESLCAAQHSWRDRIEVMDSTQVALEKILLEAGADDRVVVTGSFFTVAEAMRAMTKWGMDFE